MSANKIVVFINRTNTAKVPGALQHKLVCTGIDLPEESSFFPITLNFNTMVRNQVMEWMPAWERLQSLLNKELDSIYFQ